jgi:ubiquinone/menaquinone biosynthesis C-methylase UbiE
MSASGNATRPGAKPRVLELGCGFSKTPGAFGVDIIEGSVADLIHNLDVLRCPLEDSSWDRIICKDVLEHVAHFVRMMEEIWRVAASGAIVEVRAPFMSSVNYFSDPTPRRAFTSRSFDYFIEGTLAFRLGYSKTRVEMIRCEYDAEDRPLRRGFHRWALDWANRNKAEYENRYAFLYPLYKIFFELRVVK